jgi:hypothetical protein
VDSTAEAVHCPEIGGSISTRGARVDTIMGKEEEIAKLLSQGTLPAELVRQGHSRGTVYKVARRLAERGTTAPHHSDSRASEASNSAYDSALEADPEILDLKKELRKAQLERQLAEMRAPIDLEDRLAKIEKDMQGLVGRFTHLNDKIEGSLLLGLRRVFKCACGKQGLVAALRRSATSRIEILRAAAVFKAD